MMRTIVDELRSGTQFPGMKMGSGWRRFLFLLPVMIFLPYLLSGEFSFFLFQGLVFIRTIS